MLTRLMVITFQYMQILNHYVIHLKLIQSYVSIKKKTEERKSVDSLKIKKAIIIGFFFFFPEDSLDKEYNSLFFMS